MTTRALPVVGLLCLSLSLPAQQGPGGGGPQGGPPPGGRGMFGALNLTADQKAQAKSIFDAQRQAAQPIQDQLDTARKALYAAAKSGAADAQLEQLAAAEAPLLGQLEGVRAKAFAKFYAILTPEQKQKIDSMPGGGMGFGMMGGPGGPGGPRGFGRPRSQQ